MKYPKTSYKKEVYVYYIVLTFGPAHLYSSYSVFHALSNAVVVINSSALSQKIASIDMTNSLFIACQGGNLKII